MCCLFCVIFLYIPPPLPPFEASICHIPSDFLKFTLLLISLKTMSAQTIAFWHLFQHSVFQENFYAYWFCEGYLVSHASVWIVFSHIFWHSLMRRKFILKLLSFEIAYVHYVRLISVAIVFHSGNLSPLLFKVVDGNSAINIETSYFNFGWNTLILIWPFLFLILRVWIFHLLLFLII